MKSPRWFTPLGSVVLFASAILHSSGYIPLLRRIRAGATEPAFAGLLRASWWIFATELAALGAIALVAHGMERGERIVLLCAASTAVTAVLFLRFMGVFPGVYLLTIVTVLLLIGGWLQARKRPAT